MKLFFLLSCCIFLFACSSDDNSVPPKEPELADVVSSVCVAFGYSDQQIKDFTAQPDRAYISGYFYFEEGLGADIIFGLDIEWLEGVDNPIHFPGADWMSFAGVTREGILWLPLGSPENLEGTPTVNDKWETRDLQIALQAKTWYRMTVTCDFAKREFLSVEIQGAGIDHTEDVSGLPLQYPNYAPFDLPSLTFYTFAIRSKEFSQKNEGATKVFFDDLEAGIFMNDNYNVIFSNGFENQTEITDIPVELPVIPMSGITEDFWYFENETAKIQITSTISRSGNQAMECNASLAVE